MSAAVILATPETPTGPVEITWTAHVLPGGRAPSVAFVPSLDGIAAGDAPVGAWRKVETDEAVDIDGTAFNADLVFLVETLYGRCMWARTVEPVKGTSPDSAPRAFVAIAIDATGRRVAILAPLAGPGSGAA